jgi:hypothetical protein
MKITFLFVLLEIQLWHTIRREAVHRGVVTSNKMKTWVLRRCHPNSSSITIINNFIRNNIIRNYSGLIREITTLETTVRCVKCVILGVKCVTTITRGTTTITIHLTIIINNSSSDTRNNHITTTTSNNNIIIINVNGTTSTICQLCQWLERLVVPVFSSGIIRVSRAIILNRPFIEM